MWKAPRDTANTIGTGRIPTRRDTKRQAHMGATYAGLAFVLTIAHKSTLSSCCPTAAISSSRMNCDRCQSGAYPVTLRTTKEWLVMSRHPRRDTAFRAKMAPLRSICKFTHLKLARYSASYTRFANVEQLVGHSQGSSTPFHVVHAGKRFSVRILSRRAHAMFRAYRPRSMYVRHNAYGTIEARLNQGIACCHVTKSLF